MMEVQFHHEIISGVKSQQDPRPSPSEETCTNKNR